MGFIRFADISDAAEILGIYKPYVEETVITFEYDVPTIAEFVRRITETRKTYPYLVYEEDGNVIGYAYAGAVRERKAYQWTCELSVYVKKEMYSRGIGKALYEKLLEYLKLQNFKIVYAVITAPNPQSEKFHERFGFTNIAVFKKTGYKMGEWLDVLWMEKVIGEFEDEPAAPTAIGGITED
ncbi:MAG: GNAT family N-acetyltransferase [Oscillospiraceae bacterium]|jgi:phosphinothricin acetyltransferase|nr:GNAT family N-acetyltransferase [Oscillospiraceae bacterium]